MPNLETPALLVGYDSSDDACVYQISDELAQIYTVDFFTPIVDDPYLFGQIAAANAFSDVYAMGGTPKLAMNILCVPNCLNPETIRQILRGGHDKAIEAGCVIAGGHTIEDEEPKYGLCVTGFIHPGRILRNIGACPGDALILTKPLGSGILTTGQKAGLAAAADYENLIQHMRCLNKATAEVLAAAGCVSACTDITGFGLLGHCYEMAAGSGVSIRLDSQSIPLLDGALELAKMGIIPGGAYRNMDYVAPHLETKPGVEQARLDLLADPQTSGGLLAAIPAQAAASVLAELRVFAPWSAIVGQVLPKGDKALIIA